MSVRCAVVNPVSGAIENVIVADPDVFSLSDRLLIVDSEDQAQPGGSYVDGAFHPAPVEPGPVPYEISTKQFFMALERAGRLSKQEALDAVLHRAVPAAVQTVLDAMSEDDRYHATMHLMGSNNLQRDHPLVAPFAQSQGMSDDDVDELWRLGAIL